MTRDARVYIADVLESIAKIEQYAQRVSREQFLADTLVQDAVFRRLEVIGEAVKGIDDELRARHPEVPWKEIAGLRDVLIHGYFGVIPERVWKVVEEDLPVLKRQILDINRELA